MVHACNNSYKIKKLSAVTAHSSFVACLLKSLAFETPQSNRLGNWLFAVNLEISNTFIIPHS